MPRGLMGDLGGAVVSGEFRGVHSSSRSCILPGTGGILTGKPLCRPFISSFGGRSACGRAGSAGLPERARK